MERIGGNKIKVTNTYKFQNGQSGTAGSGRQTGGGGSGSRYNTSSGYANYTSGAGGMGSSYSGGTGGGTSFGNLTGGDGANNGGTGGSIGKNSIGLVRGVGNPSGGAGGLLVIYSNVLNGNGRYVSNGVGSTASSGTMGATSSGHKTMSSGSSGGGSINIFYNSINENANITTSVTGGASRGRLHWWKRWSRNSNKRKNRKRIIYKRVN